MARIAAAILTCAGLFLAVGLHTANAQSAPADERRFVPQAAMANMAEIQLGHLAVKKAQDPRVKKFGQMMVEEHVKAQKNLADSASGVGIQWPKQLDASHKQIHDRLSRLGSEQFDREYMKAMVDGHRDVEKMLAARPQTSSAGAQSSADSALAEQVNQWAVKTLPTVRTHLREAEQLYAELTSGPREAPAPSQP